MKHATLVGGGVEFLLCHYYSLEMLFCAFSSHSRFFLFCCVFLLIVKGGFILCLECLLRMLRSVTHIHTHKHGYYYIDISTKLHLLIKHGEHVLQCNTLKKQ